MEPSTQHLCMCVCVCCVNGSCIQRWYCKRLKPEQSTGYSKLMRRATNLLLWPPCFPISHHFFPLVHTNNQQIHSTFTYVGLEPPTWWEKNMSLIYPETPSQYILCTHHDVDLFIMVCKAKLAIYELILQSSFCIGSFYHTHPAVP